MIWWIDASAGASGDMLLGALLALDPEGLPTAQAAVDTVLARLGGGGAVRLGVEPARRCGLSATRAVVDCKDTATHRTWAQIEPALEGLPDARAVFGLLARAEAHVHGVPVETVHFHEVGALDAIADIVAVTTLLGRSGPQQIVVSPVCVGSGRVHTEHGWLPVPVPAVTELLSGVPSQAGPVAHEACTPTGAALLRFLADDWGPQPSMTVDGVGLGAGGRDTPGQPNVLRILTGSGAPSPGQPLVLVETTIDDLDPRVYPQVLAAAKAAGALEAWLTPVIMKHGRPAVTVTALTPPPHAGAVTRSLFQNTTTLGVRHTAVDRFALDRDVVHVDVLGHTIGVKRGWLDGTVVTAQPEYAEVVRAAEETGLPVREVLRMASENKRVRTPPTGETATSEQEET